MMENINKFLAETTVHGLYYFTSKKKLTKILWSFIVMVSMFWCIWQSAKNIRDYFAFNILTKETYQNVSEIEYPAITIWNSNYVRRTVIGRRLEFKLLDSQLAVLNFKDVNRTCDYKPTVKEESEINTDYIIAKLLKFNPAELGTDEKKFQELTDLLLNFISVNEKLTFVKCWFNNRQLDCTLTGRNTIMIDSDKAGETPISAFSVNINHSMVESMISSTGVTSSYFENKNLETVFVQTGNINNNGFKFLLNAHEEEYCYTNRNKWYGVGLHAKFHDRQTFPMEADTEGTIYLAPGYEYDVLVKPKKYSRKTEHMGKCVSWYDIYFMKSKNYNQQVCESQCMMETIWRICKCPYFNFPSARATFAKHHGLNVTNILPNCWATKNTSKCCINLMANGRSFFVQSYCKECKQPCEEWKFELQMTAKTFSPNFLNEFYKLEANMSENALVSKNLLMLNVFFENNMVNKIEESQKYTLRDMFIYIGSNIGLFLGMSFMSFNEIWYFISLPVYKIVEWRNMQKNLRLKFWKLLTTVKLTRKKKKKVLKSRNSRRIRITTLVKVQPIVQTTPV